MSNGAEFIHIDRDHKLQTDSIEQDDEISKLHTKMDVFLTLLLYMNV